MNAGYELQTYGGQVGLDQLANNSLEAQNCYGQYCQPSIQWYYPYSPPATPRDFEIQIEQLSADREPLLNYGAKLRLIMADPTRGRELREAIAKLKIALKEVFQNGT